MTTNRTTKPYPTELRECAVRLVREHAAEHASLAAAIRSVATKIGCSPETLRLWVRRAERNAGREGSLSVDERERIRAHPPPMLLVFSGDQRG